MPIMRPCLTCGRLIPANLRRHPECQAAEYRQRNATRPAFERELYSSSGWKRLRDEVLANAEAC
jgi:hypothetical protein